MAQELKAFGIRGEENGRLYFAEVYTKRDVDAVLAEKDAFIKTLGEGQADLAREIERLKAENERLNHALWIARADRAIMTLDYFTLKCRWFKDYMKVEPPGCDVKMVHKWANVERKCRAKAEEYR